MPCDCYKDAAVAAPPCVTRTWLASNGAGVLPSTEENLEAARRFVFERWVERAAELGHRPPPDLSSACKFSSLFVRLVFGGTIEGNYDHQFNRVDGRLVDLNAAAADVMALNDPYRHDPRFFGRRDHLASLCSCLPRAQRWAEAFCAERAPGRS